MSWLNLLVHVFGLAVCIRAYRICRKSGYLVLATYCCLAIGAIALGPTLKGILRTEPSAAAQKEYERSVAALTEKYYPGGRARPDLTAAEHQQYVEEQNALIKQYYPDGPPGIVHSIKIVLPLGPIVLMVGVWLLARREFKKDPEPAALA